MSIKLRLFLILTLATGAVWLSAAFWIERSTRAEVERVLDGRLADSANMVSSLISNQKISVGPSDAYPSAISLPETSQYSRQLSCQIWSLRGDLVGVSSGAPDERLSDDEKDGFTTNMIEGELWRVYSVHNDELGVRVMVGDRMIVRDRLVYDVIQGLLKPALVIGPVLALLIWISVGRGLVPLARLEAGLRMRSPSDLSPLPEGPAPREIRPVRRALNTLFSELERVRRRERDFTTFAAHELKTPLAGLRMQAQIAHMAPDTTTRDRALSSIIISVDRTDRMVRQLLELATVEGDNTENLTLSLHEVANEVASELSSLAERRKAEISMQVPHSIQVIGNRFLLFAALRNVTENAILASPDDGVVTIKADLTKSLVQLTITDQGPGIPAQYRDRITERFFRGHPATSGGSGLGLAIASAAMERMGGQLEFAHEDPGLQVSLLIPSPSEG